MQFIGRNPDPLIRFNVRLGLAALLMAAGTTASSGQMSPIDRPWPPGVQRVSGHSPPLSPAEALRTFYMPPGYRLQLVASEPLVQDPIMIDWDAQGRLWVVEMPAFVRDLKFPEPDLEPICRIVVLEDSHHTGKMDKRTVFADGLVLPRAVRVLDCGVLVEEPPNLWLMHDKDGDLRLHTKELVATGFGRREAQVEENANGLEWMLDNWMHTTGCDLMLREKKGKFEVRGTLDRGEWGLSQDDFGRVYQNSNESPAHVDLVPTHYYARNPNLLRTSGSYVAMTDEDNEENFTVWPVRPNPGTNRAYQFGIDRKDGSIVKFTSACSPLIYRGNQLPAELYGNLFVAEPAANLVSRFVLTPEGTGLKARKAYEKGEFLASTDERFRPVYLDNAPDGTLCVVDMYRGIIQERIDITEYLRGYILQHALEQPTGMGRIYRVVHATTEPEPEWDPSTASTDRLVAALAAPNGWSRDRAQEFLVDRGDRSAVPALMKLAASADEPRTRLRALWTLDGMDGIEPATIAKALTDESPEVRAAAVRISERWLGEPNHPIQAEVLKRIDDPDPGVQWQLAASLGALPAEARAAAIARLLELRGGDPIAMDTSLSSLRGIEPAALDKLLSSGGETQQLDSAISMLAATILRGAQDTSARELFERVADNTRPGWQRSALLRGAEVLLLGARMPDTIETKRSIPPGSPCPTCPGGRAGPGGAYAFVHPPRVRPNGSVLRLSREPVALTAMASAKDDLGERVRAVLTRVEWPGKPGVAYLRPLNPKEQRRYDVGREVYRNICQACHQPDGRGQEHLAANLIGSELALAPAQVTARILLNGKEGPIGLMPPIGAALTDDQIAGVLTYVRREWGQTGSPVDPAVVKAVRARTAGRARPWTNDELLALIARLNAAKKSPPAD